MHVGVLRRDRQSKTFGIRRFVVSPADCREIYYVLFPGEKKAAQSFTNAATIMAQVRISYCVAFRPYKWARVRFGFHCMEPSFD